MCSLSLDIKDMSILSGTSTKKLLKNMLQHGPPHHRALERKPPDFQQPDLLGSTTGLIEISSKSSSTSTMDSKWIVDSVQGWTFYGKFSVTTLRLIGLLVTLRRLFLRLTQRFAAEFLSTW